jgi:methylmalonyl-CoA mutase
VVGVCGGVTPPSDHEKLTEAGVAEVFGPGTNIPEAARRVLQLVKERLERAGGERGPSGPAA